MANDKEKGLSTKHSRRMHWRKSLKDLHNVTESKDDDIPRLVNENKDLKQQIKVCNCIVSFEDVHTYYAFTCMVVINGSLFNVNTVYIIYRPLSIY